jgi:hypothetical protein
MRLNLEGMGNLTSTGSTFEMKATISVSESKSPKPPLLSPKPNADQLVKRYSFNRKPTEGKQGSELNSKPQNGSGVDSFVTSSPVTTSGNSVVRRISAEFNNKSVVADDKNSLRSKPWVPQDRKSSVERANFLSSLSETKNDLKSPVKPDISNLGDKLAPFQTGVGSGSSQTPNFLAKTSESRVKPDNVDQANTVEDLSLKNLTPSLEGGHGKQIEEEFRKLSKVSDILV